MGHHQARFWPVGHIEQLAKMCQLSLKMYRLVSKLCKVKCPIPTIFCCRQLLFEQNFVTFGKSPHMPHVNHGAVKQT